MRAEIISIGDELTSGQRLDTNSQWLAERLLELGVPVAFHTTVGDDLADNVRAFRQAVERADIILASGGLGPTADDLTRHALAEVASVELVRDDEALAHIKALFSRRKREMPPANEIQAMLPRGSRVIANPHGTAPGIDITVGRDSVACHPAAERRPTVARIFALPGVPAEMKEMWETYVAAAVQQAVGARKVICHKRIKCYGVGESDLEAMLPDLIARQRYPLVGITVSKATITLRVTAEGQTPAAAHAAMQPTIDTIHQCLGDLIFGYEEDELEHAVVRLLAERKATLAVAEWGTGGLIAHWLAECSLADGIYLGGTIVRDATAAASLLEIPQRLLHELPRQSAQDDVVAQMAAHCRTRCGADYGLAVGAFPQADGPTTTPGDFYYAIATHAGTLVKSSPYAGHPEILRPRAAKQALNFLRLHLMRNAY